MPDGILNLRVVDVYNDSVREPLDVFLRNQTLTAHNLGARKIGPAETLKITDLHQAPQGVYRLEVGAASYLTVSRFVTIPSSGVASLTVTLPVNKDRVVNVNFPAFAELPAAAQRLLPGPVQYEAWDNLRKAGFLNLMAKALRTRVANGEPVLHFLKQITEQRVDRLFALIDPSLREEVLRGVADDSFHPVSDRLHTPPAGFHLVDSFKTSDRYGNLQLTFSKSETEWSVDLDIDDAQGFEHIFQVVHNFALNEPTHPYNIHEVLLQFQELDPGYRFVLADASLAHRAGSTNA